MRGRCVAVPFERLAGCGMMMIHENHKIVSPYMYSEPRKQCFVA